MKKETIHISADFLKIIISDYLRKKGYSVNTNDIEFSIGAEYYGFRTEMYENYYLKEAAVRVEKSSDITIGEIWNTLKDKQKMFINWYIGKVLELGTTNIFTREPYMVRLPSYDVCNMIDIYRSLDENQVKMFNYMVHEAIRNFRKEKPYD